MKYVFNITLLFFASCSAFGQHPNFTDDIAPIIWTNCATCHYDNGLPNSTLIQYGEVALWGTEIKARINSTDAFYQMPPWTPDPNYRHFSQERILSAQEINLITTWVDNGMPAGDTTLLPNPPSFGQGGFLGTPDLKLTMPLYASQATVGQDDYVCFTMPTGLSTTKILKAIEVIPGNYNMVHHVTVFKDSSGFGTDTMSHNCNGSAFGDFIGGFVPGVSPFVFPNGNDVKMGMYLKPSEDIVMAIHYPEGTAGIFDSTSVNLYFYDDTVTNVREIKTQLAVDDYSFCFTANTVDSIERAYPPLATGPTTQDVSMLNIVPHAHQLAQNFLIYMVDHLGDTIPLIHVPQWNFEWQDYFMFNYLQKLPAGARIYAKAVYDNTTNNPYNPNNPPQTICAGQSSVEEMFTVFFHYVDYQLGDEFLNLDSLTQAPIITNTKKQAKEALILNAFPNPFSQDLNLNYHLKKEAAVLLEIYDLQGRKLKTLASENQPSGWHHYTWNGKSGSAQVTQGLYLIRLQIGQEQILKKVLLMPH